LLRQAVKFFDCRFDGNDGGGGSGAREAGLFVDRGRAPRSHGGFVPGALMATIPYAIFSLIDRFATISTVGGLWATYMSAARQAGYRHGVASFVNAPPEVIEHSFASDMPKGWLEAYSQSGCGLVDPLSCLAKVRRIPFTWRLDDWRQAPDCRPWFDLNHASGLHAGFAILDHSDHQTGVISLTGEDIETHPHDRLALRLAGLEVLHRMSLLGVRPPLEDMVRLSDRERECLKWLAAGKTDWEIGQILSISAKTVNAYFERIKHKLGVSTRAQVLVAAIRRELIDIG
jgi:DNA-binding CsgD family transcriptional regulator